MTSDNLHTIEGSHDSLFNRSWQSLCLCLIVLPLNLTNDCRCHIIDDSSNASLFQLFTLTINFPPPRLCLGGGDHVLPVAGRTCCPSPPPPPAIVSAFYKSGRRRSRAIQSHLGRTVANIPATNVTDSAGGIYNLRSRSASSSGRRRRRPTRTTLTG
jgi:hypothetical protein